MKLEYLTIINDDSSPQIYNGLVNMIANIQEFRECYIQLSKFQCETTLKNIVINLRENLCGYTNNDNNHIINSRILDTSYPVAFYNDGGALKCIHNLSNEDRWIKINDFNNINNLGLEFQTIDFNNNLLKTNVNDLKFIAHIAIKLV